VCVTTEKKIRLKTMTAAKSSYKFPRGHDSLMRTYVCHDSLMRTYVCHDSLMRSYKFPSSYKFPRESPQFQTSFHGSKRESPSLTCQWCRHSERERRE